MIPDPETIFSWVSSKGVKGDATLEALCNNPKVNELILKELKQIGDSNGLKGFEIVSCVTKNIVSIVTRI